MKNFSNLILLLPCHSLEDFPVDGSKEDAQSLLAAWTALWHPQLIAITSKAPLWLSASDTVSSDEEAQQYREDFIHQHYYEDDVGGFEPSDSLEFEPEAFAERWQDSLVLIPSASTPDVFAGFQEAARQAGAEVVCNFTNRASLLSTLEIESGIDEELISDFFSLAYVRLQVEMMTRKLRYSSDLDSERFEETVLAAAKTSLDGDKETARQHLQSAFDQLQEEKNQYYPVAADLVDMVLLSDSIRLESISHELESKTQKSFVATGSTLKHIAEHSPDSIQTFKDLLEDGSMCFVAGPENELPDSLLSTETSLQQLQHSLSTFEHVVGTKPTVFMRRRAGLNASLPGILESLGFIGAIHATLDQGNTPSSYSSSMRWMGVDGGAVMAIGGTPLDAANDKSFLDLGVRIGGELDSAHVATVFFARWPTQTCESFEDLKNSTKYGNVLGDFADATSYFENVYDPGYGDSYEADEYEAPWFDQAIASGSSRPISTFVDYWANFYKLTAAQNFVSALQLNDKDIEDSIRKQLEQVQHRIELQTKDWTSETDDSISHDLDKLIQSLGSHFEGHLFNPLLWKRRTYLAGEPSSELPGATQGDGAIKHATKTDAVVELSGFGQLLVDPMGQAKASKLQEQPLVDDGESILRNEFFEVRIDRDSGGIRGVHFYGQRGNLLGQRLAVRLVDPKTKNVTYSKMLCDSCEVKTVSQIASEVKTCGRLVDDSENVLAKFTQTVALRRGCNVIDIQIDLSDLDDLELSQSNYIVSRIATGDQTAELYCDIQGGRHPIRKPSIEAPHFIEVVGSEHRFALLTHGLPWHRRASKKMLDSILIAGNEQRRSFRLGIAVDSDAVMQQAISEMSPLIVTGNARQTVDGEKEANWTLHLANRNIVATGCRTFFDERTNSNAIRVRFLETGGASGTLKVYCRHELASVIKESLDGQHLRDITLDSASSKDASQYQVIETSFAAREFFQLCLRWPEYQGQA